MIAIIRILRRGPNNILFYRKPIGLATSVKESSKPKQAMAKLISREKLKDRAKKTSGEGGEVV